MLPLPFAGGLVLLDEQNQRIHLLNPAAAAIWTLAHAGLTDADAAAVLAIHSGRDEQACAEDIRAMRAQWKADGRFSDASPVSPTRRPLPTDGDTAPICFDVDGVRVELSSNNARVLEQVVAALGECEVTCGEATVRASIRVTAKDVFELLVDGAPWLTASDSGQVVGALYHLLLHRRWGEDGWLTMIHGAALERNGIAIVMPGKSGSGKTTLATHLSRRGFGLLADDLAAVRADGDVVPWPTRLSIKRGSWRTLASTLPELDDLPERKVARRRVKLVPVGRDAWKHPPVPVRALVLPKWNQQEAAGVIRLDPSEALAALIEDRVWVGWPITEARVRTLLDWLERIPAWRLSYADLGTAEAQVSGIIKGL